MILIVENQTANVLSYLSGTVTVSANGTYTAQLSNVFPLSRDPALINDCYQGNVNINDGVVDHMGTDAVNYLNQLASSLASAVVGYIGALAPSFLITIGAKDPSGNSQPFRMNQFNDLATNFRNSYTNVTGNTTVVIKSSPGTLHGIMINDNATGGAVKVYDNTTNSGSMIATILVGSPSGGLLSASGQPTPIFLGPLGLEFQTGLTIVTVGSGNNNITVVYQ